MKSLSELQAINRQRWIEAREDSIRQDAKSLNIKNWDTEKNLWKLIKEVHDTQDELKRPALEDRARNLGVPTHNRFLFWTWPRWYTQISLDCYAEEERRCLSRELGEE